MGTWFYDDQAVQIEDVLLAHLKAVMVAKLRRSESFTVTWVDEATLRRTVVLVQPTMPNRFVFEAPEGEPLDRRRLDEFAMAANSNGGLVIPCGM